MILSIENHCGKKQKSKMALYCKDILGEMLLKETLDDYPVRKLQCASVSRHSRVHYRLSLVSPYRHRAYSSGRYSSRTRSRKLRIALRRVHHRRRLAVHSSVQITPTKSFSRCLLWQARKRMSLRSNLRRLLLEVGCIEPKNNYFNFFYYAFI